MKIVITRETRDPVFIVKLFSDDETLISTTYCQRVRVFVNKVVLDGGGLDDFSYGMPLEATKRLMFPAVEIPRDEKLQFEISDPLNRVEYR